MSYITYFWGSHGAHLSKTWQKYTRRSEYVMSHIWGSHDIHLSESCHTHIHIWVRTNAISKEALVALVQPRVWMCHGTHLRESFRFDTCIYIHTCIMIRAMRVNVCIYLCRMWHEPTRVLSVWYLICIYHGIFPMGWLRSVGSIKLWVSFAEYRLFYRALLQKRPII